jgi:molecular chaperone GrpE
MSWDYHNRKNYPYIGPRRRVSVRTSPFFNSPFFGEEEEITPFWPRRGETEVTRSEEKRQTSKPENTDVAPEPEEPRSRPGPSQETVRPTTATGAEEANWRDTAMRLQAEMDNFRKRQARRADEAIAAERERLLRQMLPVADNLARALNHGGAEQKSLQQGVELIQRELMRVLENEGVTRIEAVGQPFDPALHEAVGTRPAQAEPDTVVDEVEAGYKLGNRLLRPARVIVSAS